MSRAAWVSILLSIIIVGCATAPLTTTEATFPAPVDPNKAFDAAMAAGKDLGFTPLRGPAPDREKGFVGFVGGTSAMKETAKMLMPLLALGSEEYIVNVQLKKQGGTATGADVTVYRTGVGELTAEQKKNVDTIMATYKSALLVQLGK